MPNEYTIEADYIHGSYAFTRKWLWKVMDGSGNMVASGEVNYSESPFPRWRAIRQAKKTAKRLSMPHREEIKFNTQETKQLTKRIEALEAELLS